MKYAFERTYFCSAEARDGSRAICADQFEQTTVSRSCQTPRCKVQYRGDLFARHVKLFHDFLDAQGHPPGFQRCRHGQAGSTENPRPADFSGHTFYRRTFCPIECHAPLNSVLAESLGSLRTHVNKTGIPRVAVNRILELFGGMRVR